MVALDVPQPETLSLPLLKNGDRENSPGWLKLFRRPYIRLVCVCWAIPRMLRMCFRKLFKAFRALQSFEERSSLKTWIYRIAVNESR